MINKAFFGKSTCLKLQVNNEDIYLHMGKKDEKDNWAWEKLKMSDMECGEIIRVLSGKSERWSTVHVFKEKQNKIWVNRAEKFVFVKVNDVSKSLTEGEQEVLRILLEKAIIDTNVTQGA